MVCIFLLIAGDPRKANDAIKTGTRLNDKKYRYR